jgi:hypothetical protein
MRHVKNSVVVWVLATAVLMIRPIGAEAPAYLAEVDHLLYATPDLDLGVATIENLLGVRAGTGGQHMGFGTRNALLSLGPTMYFEIVGPDPAQPKPSAPRRFGIDDLKAPKLIAWVSVAPHLAQLVDRARAQGIPLGDAANASRTLPDGRPLNFGYTDPNAIIEHRLIPYFMDWGTSPHPGTTSPGGARLVALRLEHPDPARIEGMLRVLNLHVPVSQGPEPMIIATLEGRKGRVELRGAQ